MKDSLLARVTERGLFVLLLLVAAWLFLRGHDAPGGGFLAGVIAGIAWALRAFTRGPEAGYTALRIDPDKLSAFGLLLATVTGALGAVLDGVYLSSHWADIELPLKLSFSVGTPMLFELGIFLVVLGVTTRIVLGLQQFTSAS